MKDEKLKQFLNDHFHFATLKKAGLFSKDIKFNDYEGQAKRICESLGIQSIYDYTEIGKGVRYHVTEVKHNRFAPFVRTIGGEGKSAKIIPLKSEPLK